VVLDLRWPCFVVKFDEAEAYRGQILSQVMTSRRANVVACEASSERFDAGGVVRLYGQRGCVLILAGVARPTGADPRNQVFSNPHLAAAFWWLFQQTATPKGVTTRK
jgi:hypothetical protein